MPRLLHLFLQNWGISKEELVNLKVYNLKIINNLTFGVSSHLHLIQIASRGEKCSNSKSPQIINQPRPHKTIPNFMIILNELNYKRPTGNEAGPQGGLRHNSANGNYIRFVSSLHFLMKYRTLTTLFLPCLCHLFLSAVWKSTFALFLYFCSLRYEFIDKRHLQGFCVSVLSIFVFG